MQSFLRLAWITVFCGATSTALAADDSTGRILRQWWYEPGIEHGNPVTNRRFRVNSPEAVLHPQFSQRSETKSSGMLQILFDEDLLKLQGAELALELWGGHPGTTDRRVTINGRTTYALPGPIAKHCSHAYPVIRLKPTDLVRGHNAMQFACDQGATFWGHFIVEQACLRAELPSEHPDIKQAGLDRFTARLTANPVPNHEAFQLTLDTPVLDQIAAVDFHARYDHYDENGDGQSLDWHGFTKARQPVGHLGTVAAAPFTLRWDTSLLPDQTEIAVKATIHFRDRPELIYVTPPTTGLKMPPRQASSVKLYSATDLPEPFWSRASRLKTCTIECDVDPASIQQAELHVVVWDGGAGTVKDYFKLNGHALPVAGTGKHDVLYSQLKLDPAWLKRGKNTIELISDTEHHGIEVLLPGPALIVRAQQP